MNGRVAGCAECGFIGSEQQVADNKCPRACATPLRWHQEKTAEPAPLVNRERVAEVMHRHDCRCDDADHLVEYRSVASFLLADGVLRDEAMVKAEALEEAAGESSMCDVGLPSPDAHEKATEWLLSKASKVRAGAS